VPQRVHSDNVLAKKMMTANTTEKKLIELSELRVSAEMCSIDAQYRSLLPPELGRHYDQLMRARSGLPVHLKSFEIDGEYGRNMTRDDAIPESFFAIKYDRDRPSVHASAKCFQHLADLKTLLGPKFPWYDPAKPGRPGFFVAGSYATPCWDYFVKQANVWTVDENGKGVEHTIDFHVPRGRGDVDLFIAGSGDAVDLAAEALVHSVMAPTEKNPFMRGHAIDVCEFGNCQAHYRRDIGGRRVYLSNQEVPVRKNFCAACLARNTLSLGAKDVYSFVSKHLVAFHIGPLRAEVVTRVYSTPEKCPALFDLTYDGGIYMGRDDVRFFGISLYQHDHQMLLATPFSGSSTQELRHLKKIEAYGLDLVVPGLKWDPAMASQERGLTVVRDVLKYRAAVDPVTRKISDDVDIATKRFYRCIQRSGAACLRTIVKNFVDEEGVNASYSFVPGCTGSRIHFTNVDGRVVGPVVLVDVPGSDVHVGAFSFTPPAEFVKLWCMDIHPAPPETSVPRPLPVLPDAKTVRRASKAFSTKVRNLVTSFDVEAVVGAKRVVLAPGEDHSIELGFSFELNGVLCAQIWNLDFAGNGAPVIRCKSTTGIYVTGDSVCMGFQSHYHDGGIPFSLSAMVTSLAERPNLILDGVEEHLTSVGVMKPIANVDDIFKAHREALDALDDDRWILSFDIPEA
jgi:hypothetical protein